MMAGLLLVLTLASLDQNIVATALPGIVERAGRAGPPLLGGDRLPGRLHGHHPALREAERQLRAAGALLRRGGRVPRRVGAVRAGAGHGAAHRLPGGAGARRGWAHHARPRRRWGTCSRRRERGRYQGLFTAVFAACSVAGPLLGGFITDALSWRWIFYINLPVGARGSGLIAVALRRPNRVVQHRIDFAGAALMVGGTVFAILVLTLDASREAWSRAGDLGRGGRGGAVLRAPGLARAARRRAHPPAPAVPRAGLRRRGDASMGLTAVALFGAIDLPPAVLPAGARGRPRRRPG